MGGYLIVIAESALSSCVPENWGFCIRVILYAGLYIRVNRVFLLTLALILWRPDAQRGMLL
jgi:hypothetical protein